MKNTLTVDPTDLKPGDIVVTISDYDPGGCHCDVLVTVQREDTSMCPDLCMHPDHN